jgi:hypothetical protein
VVLSTKERFVELVRILLEEREGDERLACLDCLMSIPDKRVPDRACLAYFAHGMVRYFFDGGGGAELHYPRAAAWVRRWKDTWL